MAKAIQVVSVGPDIKMQGGISRVIEMILAHLPEHVRLRHIPTFTRYTGADGLHASQRGSRVAQAVVYLRAVMKVVMLAVRRNAVFHVHFAGQGSLIRKGLLCGVLRALRCRYVVHSHAAETELFHAWMPQSGKRFLLWSLRGADRVIVLTRFWRDYYAGLLGVPQNQLLLLPNPSELPESVPDRLHSGKLRLLFLGRVGERKGAFDLIRAFSQLPQDLRENCSLTLAGDGEVDVAAALVSQLGCAEGVLLRGWVGALEVKKLLRDSDILLLPSRAEGMAMALIEAMSWALPVVTTNAGGTQEFLEDGCNSILVGAGDVDAISAAIAGLYRDPVRRVELGKAGRKTIAQFSIASYMGKLSALYEELAGQRNSYHTAGAVKTENSREPVHPVAENGTAVDLAVRCRTEGI